MSEKIQTLSPMRLMAMGRDPFQVVLPRAERLLLSQHAGLVEVFDACITNDPAKMRYYIKAGVDLEGRDYNEDRPLHVAVAHENYKVAKILLEAGCNVFCLDVDGRKPLHIACLRANLELVQLLFEFGDGLTDFKTLDDNLRQPLHYAAQANDNDICNLLIDRGAEVEAMDHVGRRPIHFAAISPIADWEVCACLLARGADIHAVDCEGVQAIHLAATRIDALCFDVMDYLLTQGCDIDERTMDGRTPLFFAACQSDVNMVKYLLERGAEIDAKTNIRIPGTTTFLMQTALHYAAIAGTQVEIVKFLLDKGAESGEFLRSGYFSLYMKGAMQIESFELPFLPSRPTTATATGDNPTASSSRPTTAVAAVAAAATATRSRTGTPSSSRPTTASNTSDTATPPGRPTSATAATATGTATATSRPSTGGNDGGGGGGGGGVVGSPTVSPEKFTTAGTKKSAASAARAAAKGSTAAAKAKTAKAVAGTMKNASANGSPTRLRPKPEMR